MGEGRERHLRWMSSGELRAGDIHLDFTIELGV